MLAWKPVLRTEHYALFGTWVGFHALMSLFMGRGRLRRVHSVIWTGISCGWAVAWGWLFWDMFPMGHATLTPFISMGNAEFHLFSQLTKIYVECTFLLLLYYALTSYLSGAASWYWILTHVVILPASIALMAYPRRWAVDSAMLVVLLSATLRYHIWLAWDGFISLQLQLLDARVKDYDHDDAAGNSNWSWGGVWTVGYQLARVVNLCYLYLWFSDHWTLLRPGLLLLSSMQTK
jgi:hypothetical protein